MAKITFSHAYNKLDCKTGEFPYAPVKQAVLLQVLSVAGDTLTKEFIDYDTDNGKYKLSFDTLYLMLIFKKPNGDLFTTLRPQFNRFGNKREYYQNLVGQTFDIIIERKEDVKAPLHSLYHEQAEQQARNQKLK